MEDRDFKWKVIFILMDVKVGWSNLDSVMAPGVDVVCDLNEGKLPFGDDSAEYVLASHILEHLWEWEEIVIEAHRVLAPGGILEIKVPYKFRGADHPYHVRFFTPKTLDKFCDLNATDTSCQMSGRSS